MNQDEGEANLPVHISTIPKQLMIQETSNKQKELERKICRECTQKPKNADEIDHRRIRSKSSLDGYMQNWIKGTYMLKLKNNLS